LALTRMTWRGGPRVRPWEKGLGPTDPKRIVMWAQLEAESIAQRRRLAYLPSEETEPEPAAVVPPSEPAPKPKRKRDLKRNKELTPAQRRSLAWENLKLRREEP
jgi:hypothetical protein